MESGGEFSVCVCHGAGLAGVVDTQRDGLHDAMMRAALDNRRSTWSHGHWDLGAGAGSPESQRDHQPDLGFHNSCIWDRIEFNGTWQGRGEALRYNRESVAAPTQKALKLPHNRRRFLPKDRSSSTARCAFRRATSPPGWRGRRLQTGAVGLEDGPGASGPPWLCSETRPIVSWRPPLSTRDELLLAR